MKLTELEPEFLLVERPGFHREVDDLRLAQGIHFTCPGCGAHGIRVWFRDRDVPAEEQPGPARWKVSGYGLHDLTLEPSILLTSGCNWHGFVRAGEIVHA